jgi:hypothetical protein
MEDDRMDWDNDELRRAYDRGYWDARRELERHLQRDHKHDRMSGSGESEFGGDGGTSYRDVARERYRQGSLATNQGLRGWSSESQERSRYSGGSGNREDTRDYPPGDRDWSQGGHERGMLERAGDEVRSWFGDDEASRRRRMDEKRDVHSDRYGYSRVFDHADYYHQDDVGRRDRDTERERDRDDERGYWR